MKGYSLTKYGWKWWEPLWKATETAQKRNNTWKLNDSYYTCLHLMNMQHSCTGLTDVSKTCTTVVAPWSVLWEWQYLVEQGTCIYKYHTNWSTSLWCQWPAVWINWIFIILEYFPLAHSEKHMVKFNESCQPLLYIIYCVLLYICHVRRIWNNMVGSDTWT